MPKYKNIIYKAMAEGNEYSKILKLIIDAKNQGLITEEERKAIKEYVIVQEPELTIELEEYDHDSDLRKLFETMKVMAGLTKMSSPADNNLINIKKIKQKNHKKKDKEKEKKQKEEEEDAFGVTECDFGASPVIDVKKIKKK